MVDSRTQRQIGKLLVELRGWLPGVPERTLEELVEKFNLPGLVVRRLADSEGFDLQESAQVRRTVDPNSTTQPIHIELPDED